MLIQRVDFNVRVIIEYQIILINLIDYLLASLLIKLKNNIIHNKYTYVYILAMVFNSQTQVVVSNPYQMLNYYNKPQCKKKSLWI
jgi:hypothetical protein